MPVVSLPDELGPKASFFDLDNQNVVYADPRTKSTLRQVRAAPVWVAQLTFSDLCLDQWRNLAGILARLKGSLNTIRLFDHSDPGDVFGAGTHWSDGTGWGDGTLWAEEPLKLVANAALGDEVLHCIATPPDGIDLPCGFKIGLPNDRLYIVTEDVHVSPSASTPVPIAPPVKEAAAATTKVETWRPTTLFYRIGNEPIQRAVDKFGNVTLNFAQEQF